MLNKIFQDVLIIQKCQNVQTFQKCNDLLKYLHFPKVPTDFPKMFLLLDKCPHFEKSPHTQCKTQIVLTKAVVQEHTCMCKTEADT